MSQAHLWRAAAELGDGWDPPPEHCSCGYVMPDELTLDPTPDGVAAEWCQRCGETWYRI